KGISRRTSRTSTTSRKPSRRTIPGKLDSERPRRATHRPAAGPVAVRAGASSRLHRMARGGARRDTWGGERGRRGTASDGIDSGEELGEAHGGAERLSSMFEVREGR